MVYFLNFNATAGANSAVCRNEVEIPHIGAAGEGMLAFALKATTSRYIKS